MDWSNDPIARLRTIANFQFGAGSGVVLFADPDGLTIETSRRGRPRQIKAGEEHVCTLGQDGRFTLGVEGGRRLWEGVSDGRYCVTVGEESIPFVRDGKNAFAKFVIEADPAIRPRDEVCVVANETLIGVGQARLSATAMADFSRGVAVDIRDGVPAP